jgi:8-oxo-dGTP diphosphatase
VRANEFYKFGVATKAIILNSKGQIFFLKKSDKEDINPNTFDIPGGRIIFGEKPEETLIRETKEETGFSIVPLKVIDVWTFTKDNFQIVGISYLCNFISGDLKLSEEHTDGFWLDYEAAIIYKDFPDWLIESVKKAKSF